ncbi:type II secretion system F family protein [Neotabrizicola sp. sgz301269]|uniref:type II secretion system F family protein n=1 Tax=Neotabrizicola sp. sgz301269 TaxID=3276282 RepID=UPI00376F5D14
MPQFRYVAFDASGARESGNIDGSNESQAWQRLVGMGLTVVELTSASSGSISHPSKPYWQRTIPLASQADLAEQMAVLSRASLTDPQMIRVLRDAVGEPRLKRLLVRVHQEMEDGKLLSDAFMQAGSGLSPLFGSLTRIGQQSGRGASMMSSLAETLRRQEKIASQLGSALVYPLILLITGIIVFLIVTVSLAPELAAVFHSVNRPVPGELALFIRLGNGLVAWGPVLAIALLAATLGGTFLLRSRRSRVLDLVMRLPFLGPILRDAALARLTGALALLLRSRVPAVAALRETAEAFQEQSLARTFLAASATLESGRPASTAFAVDPLIPPLFRELYAVGEVANTLPDVLDAIAMSLESATERRIQRAMALLTPALTLIIGGGIAFLVYSVMSALLSINDLAF